MTNNSIIKISNYQSKDIYLETIKLTDVTDTYVNWLNDPQVNQYLEVGKSEQSLTSIKQFINKSIKNTNEYLFAIKLITNNQHIGNIKVGNIRDIHKIADISLFIGEKKCWGKGYAVQAIKLISQYSFTNLYLRKLIAGVYEPNKSSTKAFLKAGYIEEAKLEKHYLLNNQACALTILCLFNEKDNQLPKLIVE